jgi:hypothetical protein
MAGHFTLLIIIIAATFAWLYGAFRLYRSNDDVKESQKLRYLMILFGFAGLTIVMMWYLTLVAMFGWIWR